MPDFHSHFLIVVFGCLRMQAWFLCRLVIETGIKFTHNSAPIRPPSQKQTPPVYFAVFLIWMISVVSVWEALKVLNFVLRCRLREAYCRQATDRYST